MNWYTINLEAPKGPWLGDCTIVAIDYREASPVYVVRAPDGREVPVTSAGLEMVSNKPEAINELMAVRLEVALRANA